MAVWRIKPIHVGDVYGDFSFNVAYTDMGHKWWVPVYVWFLTNGEQKVLIDTGFGDPDEANRLQSLFEVRTPGPLAEILREKACSPEEIDIVIFTHLHWDHCGSTDLFTNAELFVQREEARFAVAPPDFCGVAFNSPAIGRTPSWLGHPLSLLDGDAQILENLSVITTPGHTPGHQSILVQTADKLYGLAGDLFNLYANLKPQGRVKFVPPACLDFLAWYHSARRLHAACDEIIPGHDPAVQEEWIG
ncbi:MBL fold metallo-hydrolase [candidate division KSB3 bacterium]|uniref:MBL fold metallo-hydrolase n=1 Tax=candidate division KSB3 bacterium TaxID=2044937 RepID=A0A9D5Q5R7_9BACT|nr:MBL fold metallo-hydrolase [candidate division KSB3 bacterium]MBD3325109.1 MBL fold metallo-hydrolase [candidate division KSB3 bacterium]